MRRLLLAACLGVSLFVTGCAKPHAQVEPPLPDLVPPPAPPRVVAIYDTEVEAPPAAAEPEPVEEAQPPRPRPRPRTTPEAENATKSEPARTEPEGPRPAASPSLTLKPVPGMEAKTEASIRALLGTTSRNLAKVDVRGLDRDGRTQYDTARGFLQQAEDALKSGNLVFAGKLADKAASMSALLVR